MDTTSASLLFRLRQPEDRAAWNRFVELYTPLLYHWARAAGLQESDAGDLVQEVFVLLLRKLPDFSYDRQQSFRAWLRTVTLNKWRERCRRATIPTAEDQAVPIETVSAVDDGAAELWEVEYQQFLYRRALEIMQSDFQPRTWKACWEVVVEGRSAADVGAELGLTVAAVHMAKFRVLCRLREELDGLLV
jgi:RNA polymerase sigma-70 factor (ECF subfamily)